MQYIVIGLLILLVVVGLWFEGRRSDALEGVARRLDLRMERGQHPLPEALDQAGFHLFTQGPPQVLNPMAGTRNGLDVLVFGYFFDAGFGGEGSRDLPYGDGDTDIETHGQTVVWIRSPFAGADWAFDLTPHGGPVRRLPADLGLRRVRFADAPAFDKAIILAANDPVAARRAFGTDLRRFLLDHPGLIVEGRRRQWLYYYPDRRVAPKAMASFIDEAMEFSKLLLDGVVKPGNTSR